MFPAYQWAPSLDQWPSYPWTVVEQSPIWANGGYEQPYSKYPFARLLTASPGWFPSGHDPFVVVGADPGAEPDPTHVAEAARLNYLIRHMGEVVARGANSAMGSASADYHSYVDQIKELGLSAVQNIGPALDMLTGDASKPATQHAWQLNAQLAAIPYRKPPMGHYWVPWNTAADLNAAASLALQMQALYLGALMASPAGSWYRARVAPT